MGDPLGDQSKQKNVYDTSNVEPTKTIREIAFYYIVTYYRCMSNQKLSIS